MKKEIFKSFIIRENGMTRADWARELINISDDLKSIYEEDWDLLLKSFGITEKMVENLEITEKNIKDLKCFHAMIFGKNNNWKELFVQIYYRLKAQYGETSYAFIDCIGVTEDDIFNFKFTRKNLVELQALAKLIDPENNPYFLQRIENIKGELQ